MTPRDPLRHALRDRYGWVNAAAPGGEAWPCPVCKVSDGNPLQVILDPEPAVHCDTTGCVADAGTVFDALGVSEWDRGSEWWVVAEQTRETTTTTPLANGYVAGSPRERAAALIRKVDIAAELAKPRRPITWRIDRFARDGALTVLAAKAGVGKSWFGMAACMAVTAGDGFGGMDAAQGRAVYVDAEMGTAVMVDRFRDAGLPADAFDYIDANGLNLADECQTETLEATLRKASPSLIVIDSLRRFAPGTRENESDDVAPLVARLATMARNLDAAVILLHHAGHDEGRLIRGSSAIIDQADCVFGLLPGDGGTLRLTADPHRGGKMRLAASPPDRWMRLDVEGGRGVVVAVAPTTDHHHPPAPPSVRANYKAAMVNALREAAGAPLRKAEIVAATGKGHDNQSVRAAWSDLRESGSVQEVDGGWVLRESAPDALPDPPSGDREKSSVLQVFSGS